MSLSKLGSTSGSSSQITFDVQNPFSEKHPLLLPTVLDNVFPYLTFSELKNSRLVCPTWSKVGLPFIGRRKLEPVKFSDVKFEDFLALKKEFEDPTKPHPKLKLFQGFHLTWVDVVTMAYCNFLPTFKPSQLYISGEDINDPSISLRTLLQSTVATLRDLSLKIKSGESSCYFSFDFLQDLAELGMTLKRLDLNIDYLRELGVRGARASNDWSIICRNVSNLLQNQAPFLEELNLVIFRSDDGDSKIQIPTLPHLQWLTLVYLRETPPDFQALDACIKFPNLVCLFIIYTAFSVMAQDDGTLDMTRGHALKELNIMASPSESTNFPNESLNKLRISFSFLEDFSAQYLITNGVEIPWADTLRILEIRGTSREFNFLHLKKIEELHYTLVLLEGPQVIEDVDGFIHRLLEHHNQLPLLKKLHLSGFNVSPEQMMQIQEILPARFWDILTLD